MRIVLQSIKYEDHECIDTNLLHYLRTAELFFYANGTAESETNIIKEWSLPENMPGLKHVVNEPLVEHQKMYFPPQHIKLNIFFLS